MKNSDELILRFQWDLPDALNENGEGGYDYVAVCGEADTEAKSPLLYEYNKKPAKTKGTVKVDCSGYMELGNRYVARYVSEGYEGQDGAKTVRAATKPFWVEKPEPVAAPAAAAGAGEGTNLEKIRALYTAFYTKTYSAAGVPVPDGLVEQCVQAYTTMPDATLAIVLVGLQTSLAV
jgi:hypothetical protein